MIEVYPGLFVGDATDEARLRGNPEWYIVSAAKEPWHRQALGYTGPGAPKHHPEYFWARRDNHLILNLVDVADPAYIRPEIVEVALSAIDHALHREEQQVLVHCNKGVSRSPTLALLYLRRHTHEFSAYDYDAAAEQFRIIYPSYAPARGMAEYARANWG